MTTLESLKKASTTSSQGFQKRFPSPSSDPQSFEEVYKMSYSHGLEAIYKLENVDIKSVKRIENAPKPALKKPESKKQNFCSSQHELDLGEEFRTWMPSFILREPIQVLELSKHSEKCLIENGKFTLGDLKDVNLKDFVFLRGMGQGHIEEIHQKLNAYLDGHELEKCRKIDFSSWLKCIVAAQERKKVHAFLESYDLSHLFTLTPGENAEVRKLTFEKKQEWSEELLKKIAQPAQKKAVWSDMQHVFNVFFKSWIRQRGGFAAKDELHERMMRISANPDICSKVLHFLQSRYFETGDFFSYFLHQIDHEIYCCDEFHACQYEQIVDKAITYFYKPSIYYNLQELVGLLEREFARSWTGFAGGYIEKILRLSPAFHTTKGLTGHLEIHKS